MIYTDSALNLGDTDKEMALKAVKAKLRDMQQDRDPANHEPLAPQNQARTGHDIDHSTTQIDPTQAKAAELAVESEQAELGAALSL